MSFVQKRKWNFLRFIFICSYIFENIYLVVKRRRIKRKIMMNLSLWSMNTKWMNEYKTKSVHMIKWYNMWLIAYTERWESG